LGLNFSNYLEEKIITDYFITPTVYVAIFGRLNGASLNIDTLEGELEYNDTTHEITGYDGGRVSITYTSVEQDDIDGGGAYIDSKAEALNDNSILYENMPACTVMAAAIMDDSAGGNLLMWVTLPTEKTKSAGDNFPICVEQFILKTD